VGLIYNFSEIEKTKIIKNWGEIFYDKLPYILNECEERWKLHSLMLNDYFAINCIFVCKSERYGDAVLKIGTGNYPLSTEINILREYEGKRYCKLFDADIENDIIIEELISPGNVLIFDTSRVQRISVFSSLYNNLHIAPADPTIYPLYLDWVQKAVKYISEEKDNPQLREHALKAKDIYKSVIADYSRMMLLNGDFHCGNLVKRTNGSYAIIDPKGVVGDPVFDLSRFVICEFRTNLTYDNCIEAVELIYNLSEKVYVPPKIIMKCVYIETVVWLGEHLELKKHYELIDYAGFIGYQEKLINNIYIAEKILQTN
jgi:streptomycin 6-kinase